jgi:hypothetical protein
VAPLAAAAKPKPGRKSDKAEPAEEG